MDNKSDGVDVSGSAASGTPPNLLIMIYFVFFPVLYICVAPFLVILFTVPLKLSCDRLNLQIPWDLVVFGVFSLGFLATAVFIVCKQAWIRRYLWAMIPFWVFCILPFTGFTDNALRASVSKAFSALVRPDPGTSAGQK